MMSVDRRGALLAIISVAVVQAAYWLLVSPLLFSSPPIRNVMPIDEVHVAELERPELSLAQSAPRKRIGFGDDVCCGPGYRAFFFGLSLDNVPEDGLAYASQFGADNIRVFVNGSLVRGEGRMTLPDISYHNNLRRVTHIPSGLLKVGKNEILSIVVRDHNPWFDVYQPLVGPYALLSADLSSRSFMINEYKIVSITIGIVLGILALVICLRPDQRQLGFWMVILLSAWTLQTLYYIWADSPFQGASRLAYYFTLTAVLPFSWVNVVNEWTGRPWRRLRLASVLLFSLCLLAIFWSFRFEAADASFDRASLLVNVLGLVCALLAMVRLLQHLWQVPRERAWERAILLLCISLMGLDFVREQLFQVNSGQFQTSLPLLMIAFALAFSRGSARLLQLANEFGRTLSQKLAEREAELAVFHQRETEVVRQETLVQERKRLMLDMHDGIMGHLVGIQRAARQGSLTGPEISEDIALVVDELRLVIDSLDHAGANLANALANYRVRLEPRLAAIGIQTSWRNELPLELAHRPSGVVMQALRIVQEAVTNAVKYAHTRKLDISCGLTDSASGCIVLRIRDYGSGLDGDSAGGRGLENMRARASAIGASLSIVDSQPGTTLILEIPGV